MATGPNVDIPPTSLRGSGVCPQCGERFYNRYKPPNCENCNYHIGGSFIRKNPKGNEETSSKKAVLITRVGEGISIYSVRTSSKNDRCFVTISSTGQKICYSTKCLTERSACVNQCAGQSPSCAHITAAETFNSNPVYTVPTFAEEDFSILEATPNMKAKMVNHNQSQMPTVVKVDESSYVTVGQAGTEMEVGLCHVWNRKDAASSSISHTRFLKCASRSCKAPSARSKKAGQPYLCVHLHLVILARKIYEAKPVESPVIVCPDENIVMPLMDENTTFFGNDKSRQATIDIISKFSLPYKIPLELLRQIESSDCNEKWPSKLEPEQTNCVRCQGSLDSAVLPNGQSKAGHGWLISNNNAFKSMIFLVKNCKDKSCQAVNIALPFDKGLFNVCNKIAVTLDILLEIRMMFKTGSPVTNIIEGKIDFLLQKTDEASRPPYGKLEYIKSLLYYAFYAFEVLTVRDINETVCGVCGVVGEVYYGDGNEKICCRTTEIIELNKSKSNDATMHSGPDNVSRPSLSDFLQKIKMHLLERSTFSKSAHKFETSMANIPSIIAPALLDENVNTEKEKKSVYLSDKESNITGDPVLLSKFLKERNVDLSVISSLSRPTLEEICKYSKIAVGGKSNDLLRAAIQKLYASIIVGTSPCHAFTKAEGRTGGFYHVVCRHGCTVASKFITLTESVRDAADIYLSLKYPPITFVCDTACTLVRHLNLRDPQLTEKLWGKFDGCFEEPTIGSAPKKDQSFPFIVPSEYRPVTISASKGIEEYPPQEYVHPVSGTSRRFVVGDRFHSTKNPHKSELCSFHNINLCEQAAPIRTSVQEARNKAKKDKRIQSACTQSFQMHFFYNYLMEFYQNEKIVEEQKRRISNDGKESITRDKFLRIVKL